MTCVKAESNYGKKLQERVVELQQKCTYLSDTCSSFISYDLKYKFSMIFSFSFFEREPNFSDLIVSSEGKLKFCKYFFW